MGQVYDLDAQIYDLGIQIDKPSQPPGGWLGLGRDRPVSGQSRAFPRSPATTVTRNTMASRRGQGLGVQIQDLDTQAYDLDAQIYDLGIQIDKPTSHLVAGLVWGVTSRYPASRGLSPAPRRPR